MKVDGQCQCGAVKFEAEVDPAMVSICHCTDCQNFSGSPWRASVPAPAAAFRITAGSPATYVKTADSGAKRVQAFCGACGSPIYAAAQVDTPTYNLRLGAVNQRALLPPQRQIWTKSALPWAMDIHALPGTDKG
ncbi:MAG: GFA family protein [Hyphomonadaceae bacterium]